jgi:ATP-dependent Clp protease ATP-binding subunit ClpC
VFQEQRKTGGNGFSKGTNMSEVHEKLNNEAQRAIWLAKSVSVELKVPQLYPEALAIAIISYPPNIVTNVLATSLKVEASKISNRLRDVLLLREKSESAIYQTRVGLSMETIQVLRSAVEFRNRSGSPFVGVHDIMLALIKQSDSIARIMETIGIGFSDFEGAIRTYLSTKSKERSEGDTRAGVGIKNQRVGSAAQTGIKKSRNVLEGFCLDLTAKASAGELDAVIGREKEIERLIVTLSRKKKNNPLLIGEHGVGKTAIVEGLAQRIVDNKVPLSLRNKKVFSLDLAGMVAGTTYRGQFEERVKSVLTAIKENPDVIMFIDEIHTMIGAGGSIGSLDASNMLKPALARGEMHCIGATTEAEYKRFFKKDGALDRRFQRIRVLEPSLDDTLKMLRGLRKGFEDHHGCVIPDETLEAAVHYAERYVNDRHFPDKDIDILDEACACFGNTGDSVTITPTNAAQVVSEQTGVPIAVIMPSDLDRLTNIDKQLRSVIVGQDRAIESLMSAVGSAYSGIRNPNRPMGCFLFAGPSGVGKTHTAKEFAKGLFVTPSSFIQINMTEFNDKFQASRLLGSPPGYVGHGERNQLADKVLQNPYCFVLFDEIEKADPEVMKLLLPIMSEGRLVDSEGVEINFRNAFIGMTTNIGFAENSAGALGFGGKGGDDQADKERILALCRTRFSPEFVNRIDEMILFDNLTSEELERVAELELQKLCLQSIDVGLSIEADKAFLSAFIKASERHHGVNGFRIQRAIQMDIRPEITAFLLKNRNSANKHIKLKMRNGKVVVS